jgi:RNA polymerase sigma-70 factor (ECF subfamily)
MHDSTRGQRPDPSPESTDGMASKRVREPLTQAESEFARELFERHRLSLQRYLTGIVRTREDANEILQETYLRLLRQPSFDHLRDNARAYLFQTATNLARDLFRQRAYKNAQGEMDAFAASGLDTPDWTSWPELALQGEQVGAVIVRALQDLDGQVRTALLLNRFRDMTHRQIAAWMGVSERTIERYIKEGLTHIARRLKAEL